MDAMLTAVLRSRTFGIVSKVCGFALLLSGLSMTALAVPPPPPSVPEVDAGSMTSALALLVGGALIVADRFRRK